MVCSTMQAKNLGPDASVTRAGSRNIKKPPIGMLMNHKEIISYFDVTVLAF